ncbi:MAG: hypothetical protein GXP13_05925 [Gammaproteobacteria bacterium]|nr:hypothetical protein [Gammaproteobacteria bacterium]
MSESKSEIEPKYELLIRELVTKILTGWLMTATVIGGGIAAYLYNDVKSDAKAQATKEARDTFKDLNVMDQVIEAKVLASTLSATVDNVKKQAMAVSDTTKEINRTLSSAQSAAEFSAKLDIAVSELSKDLNFQKKVSDNLSMAILAIDPATGNSVQINTADVAVGEWQKGFYCPVGHYVCGVNVKLDNRTTFFKDGVGISGLKMLCCSFRNDAKVSPNNAN